MYKKLRKLVVIYQSRRKVIVPKVFSSTIINYFKPGNGFYAAIRRNSPGKEKCEPVDLRAPG